MEPTTVPSVIQTPAHTPPEPTTSEPATQDTPRFGALASVTGIAVALIAKWRYGRSK
ncbi:MAG: hypothetical protein ACXQTR_00200 [Candidatus Methanospirareceae archaeon]